MKKLLICLSSLLPLTAMASMVSRAEADALAQSFFSARGIDIMAEPQPLQMTSAGETAPFYIYNSPSGADGFIIVAADNCLGDVLGYSDSGSFSVSEAPDGLKALMDIYAAYIRACAGSAPAERQAVAVEDASPVVAPLLGSIAWGQDYPFNTLCPSYTSGGQSVHYYVGCVATAATQIMRYYNWPAKGTGSHSYTSGGGTLSSDFSQHTYDWANMPAVAPDAPSKAVVSALSLLASDFGIAIDMEYLPEGSGAQSMLVPTALREYFGYEPGVRIHSRDYYSSSEWMNMIKTELDAARPVYYAATSEDRRGGHAFVCDGYDTNGYVHINWGWYGRSNGYFLINRLNPGDLGEGGGSGAYNIDQEILTGFTPAGTVSVPDIPAVYGGSRLGVMYYPSDMTFMSFIENLDTRAFSGSVAAVITDASGSILKVLKEEPLAIDGFAGGRSGVCQLTMRDIPVKADGVADGSYRACLAFRSAGASNWEILRHPVGLPAYADIKVAGGAITAGAAHNPTPSVTLLEPVTTDGDLYAGGTGLFRMHLRNSSSDFRLSNITVKLTSVDDPTITAEASSDVNIYDETEISFGLLAPLPADVPAGEYELTAYATGYPEYPFDDSVVGRGRVVVRASAGEPVVRAITKALCYDETGAEAIAQGRQMTVSFGIRNYSSAGALSLLARLQPVDSDGPGYVFLRNNLADIASGASMQVDFRRYADFDPGVYRLAVTQIMADGTEMPVEGLDECLVTIGENSGLICTVVSADIPDLVATGAREACSITVKPLKTWSGTFYVRVRQFTNTSGELIYMGSQSFTEGVEKTISFNWIVGVNPGEYMLILEAGREQHLVGGTANYYREIEVADPAGIDDITVNSQPSLRFDGSTLIVTADVPADAVIEVAALDGRIVRRVAGVASVGVADLAPGLYIGVLRSSGGVSALKFCL